MTSGKDETHEAPLLSRGITKDTWRSFLDTMSAFLTAKVSDRAISRAGDMAKHMYKSTERITQELTTGVKDRGKGFATSAKKGDVFNAIGNAVAIPLFTAVGIFSGAVEVSGSAIGAGIKRPRTPAQRAAAYAEVANKSG
jgi:hypothetical protein